jgi:hypothetical protein
MGFFDVPQTFMSEAFLFVQYLTSNSHLDEFFRFSAFRLQTVRFES